MSPVRKPATAATADAQLKSFIAKFTPEHQRLIRAIRKRMQARLPTAEEMVYDNYNFFVIGYSPTERPSDAVLSIVGGPNGIGVCLIYGASLPDPTRILVGSGKQTRFIRIRDAVVLDQPDVQRLISAAVDRARAPFPASGRGKLTIRAVSAKQRPRKRPVRP